MKIALITYHHSCNNGAVMQTYALSRYLTDQGHEVDIIDLRHDESGGKSVLVKLVKYFIFKYRIHIIRTRYYKKLTRRYMTLQDLQNDPPKADCYMVGSDQVWNPDISKELMSAYFLDFGEANIKRVSYASSFGVSSWHIKDVSITTTIKNLLHRFDALSVREIDGKNICNDYFGVNPDVVLDPTFLNYDYSEFNNGCIEDNSFICYKLNRTQDFWGNVLKIGELLGSAPTLLNYNFPKKGFVYCFPPSLKTWMRKFASSKFILTDSFHGIAFSIINRKQFVAILNDDGKNSRLIHLLKTMGLSDRLYPSIASMLQNKSWMKPIDYSTIEPTIIREISKSRDYLNQALSSTNIQ